MARIATAMLTMAVLLLVGCARENEAPSSGDAGQSARARGAEWFLGSWIDVANPGRFANITKSGDAYIWEDNEGSYAATSENGRLIIDIGFGNATALWDEERSAMVAMAFGDQYVFRRK